MNGKWEDDDFGVEAGRNDEANTYGIGFYKVFGIRAI